MRLQQLIRKSRTKKSRNKSSYLGFAPQVRGSCAKVFIITPRKPNSALRKVTRVKLSTGKYAVAFIPGEKHNLQQHSSVLLRGGNVKDLPGVKIKVIRGVLDCQGVVGRISSRSKYGVKKA